MRLLSASIGNDEHLAWSVLLIRPHASGDEEKIYKHLTHEKFESSDEKRDLHANVKVSEESFGLLSP